MSWKPTAIRTDVLLLTLATLSLPFGLLATLFTIDPSLGDPLLDGVYSEIAPDGLLPQDYSVLAGIASLFTECDAVGDLFVATVLLTFSVVFPVTKLVLAWVVLTHTTGRKERRLNARHLRRLESIGPWSMADVFVISVLLLCFKSIPGIASFSIGIGYYCYLTSVLSATAAVWLARDSEAKFHATKPTPAWVWQGV